MEFVLLGLLGLGFLLAGIVLGVIALSRIGGLQRAVARLEHRVFELEHTHPVPAPLQPAQPAAAEPAAAAPAPEARPVVEPPPDPGAVPWPGPAPGHEAGPTAMPAPEHRPPATPPALPPERWRDLEDRIGRRWVTWTAVLFLFLGAAFFIKYAFDNQWLGPTARVVLGLLAGVAMLVAGDRTVRRAMRALGQGLLGGGLAMLYLALFAATSLYEVLPPEASFAGMVVVTAAGMTLAVLHDAVPLAIIAVLGGFLTPVLVSTGRDARDALFTYVLLLDLGVLGAAFFRRWKALDALAFVGTWVLFAGWFERFYDVTARVPTMAWAAVFWVLFYVLPFVWHVRTRIPVTIERFVLSMLNAFAFFGAAFEVLHDDLGYALGFVALVLSAAYVALGAVLRRRLPTDARALFGAIGLAVGFLTLAIPLELELNGITLAWAIEAPVLLWLGYRFDYFPVRVAGLLVLCLATVRLFSASWPLHEYLFVPFLNTSFGGAAFLPASAAAFAVIHRRFSAVRRTADGDIAVGAAVGAGALGLLLVEREVSQWFHFSSMVAEGRAVSALLWSAGATTFVWAGVRQRSRAALVAGLALLAWAIACGARPYLASSPAGHAVLNARFAGGLAAVAAVFATARLSRGGPSWAPVLPRTLGATGLVALWLLLTGEAWVHFRSEAEVMAHAAVSIVWGAYAVALLMAGFRLRLGPVRLAALGLLGLTAAKLILIDMAAVQQVWRIVTFLVLGLLMIGASYLYHRAEKRLSQEDRP